jgi:signal peptidase I
VSAAVSTAARDDAADAPREGHRRRLRIVAAVAVVVLLLAVRAWVAEPFRIPSGSMEPTLRPGDQVLVDKLAYRSDLPARGDLAAFQRPGSSDVFLKRVVGLPGDTVEMRDGYLYVDHRRLREPFVDHSRVDSVFFGPVRVPRGRVFLMGDNRGDSIDSRDFGAIPRDDLIGRVALLFWPPGRIGTP